MKRDYVVIHFFPRHQGIIRTQNQIPHSDFLNQISNSDVVDNRAWAGKGKSLIKNKSQTPASTSKKALAKKRKGEDYKDKFVARTVIINNKRPGKAKKVKL